MYITDARHFLDDKGAIAPLRGPAKAMADFHAGVIAYATDFDDTKYRRDLRRTTCRERPVAQLL